MLMLLLMGSMRKIFRLKSCGEDQIISDFGQIPMGCGHMIKLNYIMDTINDMIFHFGPEFYSQYSLVLINAWLIN
ncbi:hypothetical protein G157_00228 [Escherichia phage vB_EcoM-G157lw]|nr:hypothetical protein G157_00228 [Escherichia phage vB_EcoM-G157lw]